MKYIPTDKLIAEIERRQEERQDRRDSASLQNEYWPESEFSTRDNEDDVILFIIASLQQEQPEIELEKEINEYIDSEWCDEYSGDVGNWIRCHRGTKPMEVEDVKNIARHFYELGLNARTQR